MSIITAPQVAAAISPTFTLSAPLHGSYTNMPTMPVSGTIMADLEGTSIDIYVGNSWKSNLPVPATSSVSVWNTTVTVPAVDGAYTIKAVAKFPRDGDVPGSTSTLLATVVLDTVAPTVTSITEPAPGTPVEVGGAQGGTVTVTAIVNDQNPVASVQASAGVAWVGLTRDPANTSRWSGPVPLQAALGSQVIGVRATDLAGNVTPAPALVFVTAVDRTAPAVAITSPAANPPIAVGELGDNVPVVVTATDAFSVASVKCRVGTGEWVPLSGAGSTWSGAVLVPGLPLGSQTITARATDASGNFADASVTVTTLDKDAPVFEITAPPDGARITRGPGATITFVGSASDRQSGVKSIAWSVDGGATTTIPKAPPVTTASFSVPIDCSQLEPGMHSVQFTFTDAANPNHASFAPRSFEVASIQYATAAERLSERAYLDALTQFITKRAALPSRDLLGQLFYQPFVKLIDSPTGFGLAPVNQLRIGIEALRKHLANPIGHWKLDESSGTVASDSSINGNNATLVNAPARIDGRFGKALSFNGSNYAQVANAPVLEVGRNGADFSVAIWLNLSRGAAGKYRRIVCKSASDTLAGERTFALFMNAGDNRVHYCISTAANANQYGYSTTQIALNTWTHIAYVKAGNQLRLYINGTAEPAVTLNAPSIGNSSPIYLGNVPWAPAQDPTFAGFDGALDDVRIYDFALAPDTLGLVAGNAAAIVTAGEDAYRLAAYQAMLAQLGTSYDEIRFIRAADPATEAGRKARQALADRLGIALSPTAPDELEQLFRAPAAVTEPWLAEKFGLADTTVDVPDSTPTPTVLAWQRSRLQQQWKNDDYPASPAADLPPIIDPDLIDANDFTHPVAGDQAYLLWTQRQADVTAKYNELKGKLAGKTAPNGFSDIVNAVLTLPAGSGVAFLQAVEADYRAHKDVVPALRGRNLDLPAFLALLRVRDLAAGSAANPPVNMMTDADWADALHILVQAWKVQNYTGWRDAENGKAITLTPATFQIASAAKPPTAWRASESARRAWQARLRARIAEDQALQEAFDAAVAAAEEAALPLLRDVLISRARDLAAAKAGHDVAREDVADALTARLQVDLRAAGAVRTTRTRQAIATLQGLVFALRGGLLDPSHPAAGWNLLAGEEGANADVKERNFAEEWGWNGSYDNWRAATTIYLYPETLLLPSLRTDKTPQYVETVEGDSGRLTPVAARATAKAYWTHAAVTADLVALVSAGKITEAERLALEPTDGRSDAELRARRAAARKLLLNAQGGALPNISARVKEVCYFIPLQLGLWLQNAGEFAAALDWFRLVYAYNLPAADRKVYALLEAETATSNVLADLPVDLNPHRIVAASRAYPYTRYTLLCVARCFLDFADSEFARGSDDSIARARTLYATARELLRRPELPPQGASESGGTILPNPVLDALRQHVEARLTKLRQGRNIAGVRREAPLAPGAALPAIPAAALRPTPYRFKVLLERSKQLVAIAQQIEAAYLAALEKRDAETYNRLKANNDLDLASAGEELQARRITEAEDGQDLVARQKARNDGLKAEYFRRLNAPLNDYEQAMIASYNAAAEARRSANFWSTAAQIAGSLSSDPVQIIAASLAAGALTLSAISTNDAITAENNAQISAVYASWEHEKEQWEMQFFSAEADEDILGVQARLADDHLSIVQQEQAIATLQSSHDRAVANFLATKFTNAELYEWMSGVLGKVYSYFLQQATAMAQLAQMQLAFERAAQQAAFVRGDYWQPPSVGTATNAPDRRGMTGSARLLEDITRLDQFAFESDKRKLNMSQTFSLAQLFPYEFQKFRDTGMLSFTLGMELFDRAFPGHYLRLIKRVRTSVIALIPPVQGIRATLATSGSSTVVTDGDVFAAVPITRDPELVALTSPTNASGLFELDMQSEMLQPFEDRGVDTKWEFRLPKAANAFSYDSIMDVMITIDYTALDSADYRDTVIRQLDPAISAQRAFNLRDFVDGWYSFNNPAENATSRTMTFTIRREHFPPNLKDDDIQIEQLLACFVPKDGVTLPSGIKVANLYRGPTGQPTHEGNADANGVISTRRSGGLNWQAIKGTPVGDWTMTIDDTATMQLFADGKVDDILFVLTYRAELPAWI